MVDFNIEELRSIADISSLQLDEEEMEVFLSQITKVLEYMEELNGVQVGKGHETVRTINVFREDKVRLTNSSALLALAPQIEGTFFVVPKVLE